ncbi:MAG: DUF58 domain-containing protein [Candidatus Methanofastidiosa archaeon]|nr:DUF58 domain-containing protein [Candidatus Methanofastidiosa archaeon]
MELSRIARLTFIFTLMLFAQGYITGNVLPTLLGMSLLSYLLFARSSFANAVGNGDAKLSRAIERRSLFAEEPVRVEVSYSYPFGDEVMVGIKDVIPKESFTLSGSETHTEMANALKSVSYGYELVRTKRGTAVFEGAEVSMEDKRGLFLIEHSYILRDELTYQDSRHNIKRAESMAKGSTKEEILEKELSLSPGYDFSGIRDYQPGDKISDIDWKASSRFGQLLTKLSEKERYGRVFLLLDASRTMRATHGDRSKFGHSILLCMQMAKIFLEHDNPTGFIVFDEHSVLRKVDANMTKGQYGRILMSIEGLPDAFRATYKEAPSYEQGKLDDESREFLGKIIPYLSGARRGIGSIISASGLYSTVRSMTEGKKEKSLLLVVSDLETQQKGLIGSLKLAIAEGNDVILVTPYSPWYDMSLMDLDVGLAESLYSNYLKKKKALAILKGMGVKLIEETPDDSLDILYPKIAGEMG